MNKKKYSFFLSIIFILVFAVVIFIFYKSQNTNIDKNVTVPNTPTPKLQTPQIQSPSQTDNINKKTSEPPNTSMVNIQNFKTETFQELNISLDVPGNWQRNTNYDYRYEGNNGFVELTALSGYGIDLKEVIDSQINLNLKPYGENPNIKNITVDSQKAAIITPSNSQNNNLHNAIILTLPKAININSTPYYYLIFWTDKDHIETLAEQIKFISK